MAASKQTIVGAQQIIPCQFCETDTRLRWKCFDCDILMCHNCKEKIHAKIKTAKDHKIKDIKEVGVTDTSIEEQLDFTNIKCKSHPAQNCCIYCTSCDLLLCPSCLAKGHSGHKFIEIKESYDVKSKELASLSKDVKPREEINQREAAVDELKTRETGAYNQTLTAINNQRDAIKQATDQYAEDLIGKVKRNMAAIDGYVTEERKQLSEMKAMSTAVNLLSIRDTGMFFDQIEGALKEVKSKKQAQTNLKPASIPSFTPGVFNQETFGSLVSGSQPRRTQIKLAVKRKFTTDLKYCHDICLGSEGVIWLAENEIENINIQLMHIFEKRTFPHVFVFEMKPLPNGDILIADKSSTLKIMNRTTGEVTSSKCTAKSLYITAVHITRDQDVIVGARSTEQAFPVQGRRVLIVFDRDGKIKEEWEFDDKGGRMFSVPRTIDQAKNNNIFVLDYLSADDKGRIVILSPGGKVIATYTGHPDINNEENFFQPSTVRNTPSDNMVVIDYNNKFIHLLDNTGNSLSYLDTTSIFPDFPYCIAFSDGKTAYIGCTTETDSEEKAKLYELEYTEC